MASLYVGNLQLDVTERMLFEKFSTAGPVIAVQVCRDMVTYRSLGYAYINFQHHADAKKALDTMNFDLINGYPIRIMWSQCNPLFDKFDLRNVFIKNLDKSIDNDVIHHMFSIFGNILTCKVAEDENGVGKGYAFVQFESNEAANKCIDEFNGKFINGIKIYAGRFIPASECDNDFEKNAKLFTNIYVKNFDEDMTEDRLRAIFEKYGQITSLRIMNTEEGKPRGFAFVTFEDPDCAEVAVLELNGKEVIEGKPMYVGYAQKKTEGWPGLRQNFEQLEMDRLTKNQLVHLYVTNLDDTVDDERLYNEFATFGNITSAKIMMEGDRSKGCGFVCFSSREKAAKAVTEMNGYIVGSKALRVVLAHNMTPANPDSVQEPPNQDGEWELMLY